MALNLPFEIVGPAADQLRATLNGSEDYFATKATWNGRSFTLIVAAEGAAVPTAEPEPIMQTSPVVVTGVASSEPDGSGWDPTMTKVAKPSRGYT